MPELKKQNSTSTFWDRMEENAKLVDQMPNWKKGYSINARIPIGSSLAPPQAQSNKASKANPKP